MEQYVKESRANFNNTVFSLGIVGCGLNQTDNMEKELKEESCFQQDDAYIILLGMRSCKADMI